VERICSKPLFTYDELLHYQTALVEQFSHLEIDSKTDKRSRPKKPQLVIDPELKYATVHKTRENGKVVNVERNITFGDLKLIDQSIEASKISNTINTSFIERTNLTLRNHSGKLTSPSFLVSKIVSYFG
jgi:hypothetical protein